MKYRLGSRDTVEKDIWSGGIDVEEEVRHLLHSALIVKDIKELTPIQSFGQ